MKRILYLISLGCTKNLIDSEVMLSQFKDYILNDDPKQADLIIVNTCGFIQSAKEESLNTLLELHNQRKKDSILVMAGCLSQRYKDELQKELIEIDIFTGVGDYDNIRELVENRKSKFSNKVFLANNKNNRVITGSSYHAYIKLSEGCNQICSFCAIPSFKGKLHSRTLQSTIKEVKYLVSQGYFDFSFVSQDSSSYLRDFNINNGLQLLIDEVDKIKDIKSARILYLYPSTTTISLINKIINSKKFHNYFDMPLQHINSDILRAMKRGKDSNKIKLLMDTMKKAKHSFIRTTFIVGYPGEDENNFIELCNYVKNFKFDRANIFSYSDEENTYAYRSKNKIGQEIIDNRAEILGKIVKKSTKKKLKKDIGKIFKIVVNSKSSEHDYLLSARKLLWAPDIDGEIYINDNKTNSDIIFGEIYLAKITKLVGDKLIGTIIEHL